jgi:hypothetical protein
MSYERAADLAGKASYTSAGGTVFAGFELNECAVIIGIIATLITLGLNWYYKQQHLKLSRRLAREHIDFDGDPE